MILQQAGGRNGSAKGGWCWRAHTCVVRMFQLKECDCRLQKVEAVSGRISKASLNSQVQTKHQICIWVLCFQAHHAAVRKKYASGGTEGTQQAKQALKSAGSEDTMEKAQQAGGGVGDKSVCKAAVGWGLCSGGWPAFTLYWSISEHGPRTVCPLIHFIVRDAETWGKKLNNSPSKAFLEIRHKAQHMAARHADRNKLQCVQHFCRTVLPVEGHLNPTWSPLCNRLWSSTTHSFLPPERDAACPPLYSRDSNAEKQLGKLWNFISKFNEHYFPGPEFLLASTFQTTNKTHKGKSTIFNLYIHNLQLDFNFLLRIWFYILEAFTYHREDREGVISKWGFFFTHLLISFLNI